MKALLYYLVRKLFSQSYRNKLKITKYQFERRLYPFYKWWNGTFSAEDLERELASKLPEHFDILMVHSSHSDLLPMYTGSLSELLNVFLKIAGPDRTLVMPAFFFGERRYSYDLIKFFSEKPFFDVQRMPSQMGLLTEIFRKYPNVQTSIHPTHRICALGPLAHEIVKGHELCRTGCGGGSPFDRMTSFNTIVLGVGVPYYRSMTQTHLTEDKLFEQGKYPTKFDSVELPVKITNNGKEIDHRLTLLDKSPYERRIHPLLKKLLGQDLVLWKYHGVPMYYANAALVTKKLNEAALAGTSVFF